MRVETKSPEPMIQKEKKVSRRWKVQLVVWLVVICIVAFGLTATGLISIPGVSSLLGVSQPRDLGVKASPEALASLQAKIPVAITGDASNFCLECLDVYEGSIEVSADRSSEEITSFLQLFPRKSDDILKHTQVRFIEGGMEISTKLKKYINAPVYAKVLVSRTGDRSVAVEVVSGKVGLFSVPKSYLKKAGTFFTELANKHLGQIDGYRIDSLEYHDGVSSFTGSYPAKVSPGSGTWTEVF
jgi:hypothetical protein